MSKTYYEVLSPDGFTIEMDIVKYPNIKKAIESFNKWKQRYVLQGYYSSNKYGRIPLNELRNYCEFNPIK